MNKTHWILSLILSVSLLGCGSGGGSDSVRVNNVQISAASADGKEVDLSTQISYELAEGNAFLKTAANNSRSPTGYDDALEILAGSGSTTLIARQTLSATDNSTATVSAWLNDSIDQSRDENFASSDKNVALAFSNDTSRQTSQISALNLQLVPGSYSVVYSDALKARQHKFKFKVLDQNNLSVSGLESNFNEYFSLSENGAQADRETISNAQAEADTLTCYFVIDASYSISQAGSEAAVRESVSKLVISLAPVAKLNYRQFATNVKTINGVRELTYKDTDRFTSLYAGIDQTLTDIINNSDSSQKVMIVFTDGEDNYSQNYYPQLADGNAVYSDLISRIQNEGSRVNGGLAVYTVGLGSDIDVSKLTELANAGKGAFVAANSPNALNEKFSEIYRLIKSSYTLSYLSPNLGTAQQLSLTAKVNGLTATLDVINTN